jgi:cobalt-precorrin-5B (C1)-methyltransferase
LEAGAELPLLKGILHSVTADAALALLWDAGLLEKTMTELGKRIDAVLRRRVPEAVRIAYICFTNARPLCGVLTKSADADELMNIWRKAE